MTESEAIQFATQHLANVGQIHNGFAESRLLSAARLNGIAGYEKYEGDIWVIDYWRRLPPGVLVESPAAISVVVVTTTGRVFILSSP